MILLVGRKFVISEVERDFCHCHLQNHLSRITCHYRRFTEKADLILSLLVEALGA